MKPYLRKLMPISFGVPILSPQLSALSPSSQTRITLRAMIRFRLLLASLWLLGSISAAAADWRVLPADTDPDQLRGRAVLLLSIQTDRPLRGVRIEAVDRRDRIRLGPYAEGNHLQAIELQPGRYRFAAIGLHGNRDWMPSVGGMAAEFQLAADAVSFAGALLVTDVPGTEHTTVRLSNRSARAWERLRLQQPALVQRWALRYAGLVPDQFPSFWQSLPALSGRLQLPPLQPDSESAPARDYFRPRAIGDIGLSPDGRLLAMSYAEEGPLRLWLIDLDTDQRFDLRQRVRSDSKLQWCGRRCLAVTSGDPGRVTILRLLNSDQRWTSRSVSVPAAGYVVDPLPQHDNRLLFGRVDSGKDALEVYDLDVRGGRIDPRQLARGRRLDRGLSGDFGWVSDSSGVLQAALLRLEAQYLLQSRDAQGQWRTLISSTPESQYDPLGSDNNGGLYALSEHVGNTRALVRTDLKSGDSVVLHAQPQSDLVGVVLSQTDRQPLAVRYFVDNRLYTRGLTDDIEQRLAALQLKHTDESLALTQIAADGQRWLYFTDSPAAGGRWWVHGSAASEPVLIGEYRPWLKIAARSPARTLTLQTAEGWTLQAVVVEPRVVTAPLPVVVLPHGGPVGVRDSLLFDPQAQYLASQGLAVLKVNFRGSTGYGKAFRRAAHAATGVELEDDIVAALNHLLADPRYDRQRVCTLGSSYGGYAALMLAVRNPQLIRCVAALAPITDLPLRFSSSDWNEDPLQTAFQRRLYGDPLKQQQRQIERSPLYRYEQLVAPVLLGHGSLDRRVDPEHSRRLALVLARAGRPTPVLWYANEAHGLRRADNLANWMRHAAGFINQHLGVPPEPKADPQ